MKTKQNMKRKQITHQQRITNNNKKRRKNNLNLSQKLNIRFVPKIY
jgi:hypothetical protein